MMKDKTFSFFFTSLKECLSFKVSYMKKRFLNRFWGEKRRNRSRTSI